MPAYSGDPSWNWATYFARVQALGSHYAGYPVGLNVAPQWWTLQLDRSLFTFTETTTTSPLLPELSNSVSYGSAINIDADPDLEILQVGWKSGSPSAGYFVVADFANGVLQSTTEFAIEGAGNVWALQDHNTGGQMIVLVGLDEGKLGTTPLDHALAETLIYDPLTQSLIHTGIINTSHESTVVDFDHDGDDDIITANWQEPANGQIVWLRNDGNTLTAVPFTGPPVSVMALEVLDLDNDGTWEIILTDAAPGSLPDIAGERNCVYTINQDLSLTFRAELPLPYFQRPAFDGLPYQPGWEGGVGRSHDIEVVAADIDGDGDQDAVMSSMIWGGGAEYAGFQILINDAGTLVDETDQRMFNMLFPVGGTHNFTMRDVNGDGFIDIISQNGGPANWDYSDVDRALTHNNALYINDGTGHFGNAALYQYFADPGWSVFTFAGEGGLPRWVQIQELTPGELTVKVAEYAAPLSTGPGLLNPALEGAPGYNEFYYLLSNADVAAAVAAGTYATGLAHFLAIGRAEGRMGFAPNATVQGSDADDTIILREGNETAYGHDGNDILYGLDGHDVLIGGFGNDTLDGGAGADDMDGGPDNDIYYVDDAGDQITDQSGAADEVRTTLNTYSIGGLIAIERLTFVGTGDFDGTGKLVDNVITGGAGNDTFHISGGLDTFVGGAGDDTYLLTAPIGAGLVVEQPGQGTDTVVTFDSHTLAANVENLTLTSPGGSYGIGNELANVITGSSGDNTINGNGGADELRGSGGTDFLYFDAADTVVNGGADYDYGFAQGAAGVTINLAASEMENIAGNVGNDILNASGATWDVVLNGGAGADQLIGGSGNDTLGFDAADTTVQGGAGTDFAWAITETAAVTVNMAAQGIEIAWGGSGADTLNAAGVNVAVQIDGKDGNDIITGGNANNILIGNGGADQITGGDIGDQLYFDHLDTVVMGGGGFDYAYVHNALGVSVDFAAQQLEAVFGGFFDDILDASGMSTTAYLLGNTGADQLRGGAGNDIIWFDDQDTAVDGGGGYNFAYAYNVGFTPVTVDLAAQHLDTVWGGFGNDVLDASGKTTAVVLVGLGGADQLTGGSGDDTLSAGSEDDILKGGAGSDTIFGEGGTGDVSVYDGVAADYTVTMIGANNYTVTHTATGATDTLFNVEFLRFLGTPGDVAL